MGLRLSEITQPGRDVTITKMVRMCVYIYIIYAGAFDRVEARNPSKGPAALPSETAKRKKIELLPSLLNFDTSNY
jgi:hypothetical protein